MKLILLEGGPASGKNTLGALLIEEFHKLGDNSILLDLDSYVEKFNPKWVWMSEKQKERDLLNARMDFAKDINKYLQDNLIVIVIGERFLTKSDYVSFINRLEITCPTYLYHLSVPFSLRKQRLHQRGPHSIIDLEKDQKERDAVKTWLGYVYENINTPKADALNLMKLIRSKKGLISINKTNKLPPNYVAHPDSYYRLMKKIDTALNLILSECGIKAKKMKVLEESYSASVPIVVTTSKGKYFVKIADQESISNEVCLYRFAEKYKIDMPRLLHYDLSRKLIPFTYYVAEYVDGLLPYGISKKKLYDAGHFSGRTLRKIHQIRTSGFGSVDSKFRWKYKSWLDALISERKLLNDIVANQILSQKEIDSIDELTIYNRDIGISKPTLIHGDLWEGNVLYRKHPEGFVITDAGSLIGGDPMYDLAYSMVPRTAPFEKGVDEGYKFDALTENEMYRFKILKVFCLLKEATDYKERKDAKFKIDGLVKTLRAEMRHFC